MARRRLKKVVVKSSYIGPYIPRDMKGEEISIPAEYAKRYEAVGLVEIIRPKKETKKIEDGNT